MQVKAGRALVRVCYSSTGELMLGSNAFCGGTSEVEAGPVPRLDACPNALHFLRAVNGPSRPMVNMQRLQRPDGIIS